MKQRAPRESGPDQARSLADAVRPVVIGLPVAALATPLLAGLLHGTDVANPTIYAVVAVEVLTTFTAENQYVALYGEVGRYLGLTTHAVLALIAVMVWIGLFPSAIFDKIEEPVNYIVRKVDPSYFNPATIPVEDSRPRLSGQPTRLSATPKVAEKQ